MKNPGRPAVAAMALIVIACLCAVEPMYGEFGVGRGNIEKSTNEASARFNDALSSFHLMLAALDRNQQDDAAKYRDQAMGQLKEASRSYEEADSKADNHTLKAVAKTPQEDDDLKYFWEQAKMYGVRMPVSQKALLAAISAQVSRLAAGIGNLRNGSTLRQRQKLADSAAELQRFLISATTLLTIG